MNRSQLIQILAQKTGKSPNEAAKIIDSFFQTISEALQSGEKVVIPQFGTFQVIERGPRTIIHPKTKEPINMPQHTAATFKPAKNLKFQVR